MRARASRSGRPARIPSARPSRRPPAVSGNRRATRPPAACARSIRGSSRIGGGSRRSAVERLRARPSLCPPRLRRRETKAVVEVVGEEVEQRPVDLRGLVHSAAVCAVLALDRQAFLPRQLAGELERPLRGVGRLRVVAERRPRGGQRGMRERILGLGRDRLHEQVPRGEILRQPEPARALRYRAVRPPDLKAATP